MASAALVLGIIFQTEEILGLGDFDIGSDLAFGLLDPDALSPGWVFLLPAYPHMGVDPWEHCASHALELEVKNRTAPWLGFVHPGFGFAFLDTPTPISRLLGIAANP